MKTAVNVHLKATATYEADWQTPDRPPAQHGSGPWYIRVNGAYGENSLDARGHSLEGALQSLVGVVQRRFAPQPGETDDRCTGYAPLDVHLSFTRIVWPGRQGESDPEPTPEEQ